MPTHRLTGTDLEALLARVPVEHGAEAAIVEANKLRHGGIAGFFAKETFEVVVEVPEPVPLSQVTPDESAAGGAPTLSTEGEGFAEVLARLVRDVQDGVEAAQAAQPTQPAQQAQPLEPAQPTPPAQPTQPLQPPQPFHPVRAVGPRTPPPDHAPPAGLLATGLPGALSSRVLAELGMPEDLASMLVPSGDTACELLRLLERVPRPDRLPSGPGSVIVVLGTRDDARTVAGHLAGELRIGPDSIALAAPRFGRCDVPADRRITCREHADDRRRAWRRRRRPTVVAVDSPVSLDATRGDWARHVVDALEPSMVWGVVDATRKTEDIAAWCDLVGGVDALAVRDLGATASPAAVLGAGIPVGLIDGEVASPARWVAVLTERIAA